MHHHTRMQRHMHAAELRYFGFLIAAAGLSLAFLGQHWGVTLLAWAFSIELYAVGIRRKSEGILIVAYCLAALAGLLTLYGLFTAVS